MATKMGRPREFRKRRPMTVLLEERERVALHRLADAGGVSASALVRRLILAALTGKEGK